MAHADLQSQYDEAASWWQRTIYRLGYRFAYEELMPRALEGLSARTVADVGTGSGDLAASYCIRMGAPEQLTLIDGSAQMLVAAQANLRHIAPIIDTRHAMLGDTSETKYDLVLCAHLIEHLSDTAKALADLGELIAPGGHMLLIVSQPHWCNWVIWLKWRHRWFSEKQMTAMIKATGLTPRACIGLHSGPPSRTSLAYLISRPE